MTKNTGISVVDLVSEGRYEALLSLRKLFGTTDLSFLVPWTPILEIMQAIPTELNEAVVIPIIEKFFEDEFIDPKHSAERSAAIPFVTVIAANVQLAMDIMTRNAQEQQAQTASGRPRITNNGLVL
jgi:hypothetical protein